MAMDEMKRGQLVMKLSLTILENNDKEDLDLRNSSEIESTLLRKLLGLGKEENRESDGCKGKTLEVEDLNSSCSQVYHNSLDAIGQETN